MSIARTAARHTLILMATRVTGMVSALVSVVFYTRVLKQSDVALISVLGMLGSLSYLVSNMGLGLYLARQMPRLRVSEPEQAARLSHAFVAVTTGMLIVCSLAVVAGSKVLAGLLLEDDQTETVSASADAFHVALLAPAILALGFNSIVWQLMRGCSLFTQMGINTLLSQIIQPVSAIGSYLLFGTPGMLLGMAGANAVVALVGAVHVRHYLIGPVRWREILRYIRESWPFYAEDYAGYLVMFADQWLVGLLMTPSALATYYIPRTLCDRLFTLIESMNNVALANISTIAADGVTAVRHGFERLRRVYIYVLVPVCTALMIGSFWLIDLLGGPAYRAGAAPFMVLTLVLLVSGGFSPHSMCVMVLASPKKRLVSIILQSITLLATLVPFGWTLGLAGIAASRVAAKLAHGIYSVHLLRDIFSFRMDKQGLRTVLLPGALLAACGLLQILLYRQWIVPMYLAVGLLVYAVVFLRLASPEDIRLIESLVPKPGASLVRLLRGRERSAKAEEVLTGSGLQ